VIRLVIVDDDPMVRTGLRLILSAAPDIAVVGEGGDGREGAAVVRAQRPDVVLLDVRMPEVDGLTAAADLLADAGAPWKVIMLTTFDLDEYVYAAIAHGASGFLLKDVAPERLISAVRAVGAGDVLLAPSITQRLVARYAQPATPLSSARLEPLTDREREVLTLIARGLSNGEIAERLYLGESTVKTHVGRILTKLDVRDRAQAVIAAYESGLVRPGDDTRRAE
jgi:DNA-binding NarL/FixJ family response regulator